MKKDLNTPCPIARSLDRIGDRWSFLILRDALTGLTRFDQFRKSLGIAPTMLTQRLCTLTEEGVLEKKLYSEKPPREEYLLTEAGRDFMPILAMIGAWGRKYRCEGGVTKLIDDETGKEIQPIVVDEVTGAKLGTRPMRIM
jgi:DNA-binding HxlR family transcriptional regulator